MQKFQVSLILPDGSFESSRDVEAEDWNAAVFEVLEDFKGEAMVAHSQEWNVRVRQVK